MNRFNVLLGVGALAGLGILGYLVTSRKAVSIPANVAITEADTAGFRGYLLGAETAPVEVVEYADFQCPACAGFETVQFPDIKTRLIDGGRVRWRYRDFPLEQHPHARVAAHATACANDQGKYWEVHRMVYEAQADWAPKPSAVDDFRSFAQAAGLDMGQYDECMTSAKYAGRIEASRQEAMRVGAQSTPTLLINGRLYPGGMTYDLLKAYVDSVAPAVPAPIQ